MKGKDDKGELPYNWLWQNIYNSVHSYADIVNPLMSFQQLFVCISIIGCKDVITETNTYYDLESKIDRNKLLCYPCVFEIDSNRKTNHDEMSRFHLDFLTSIGVQYDQTVNLIVDKLYGP